MGDKRANFLEASAMREKRCGPVIRDRGFEGERERDVGRRGKEEDVMWVLYRRTV